MAKKRVKVKAQLEVESGVVGSEYRPKVTGEGKPETVIKGLRGDEVMERDRIEAKKARMVAELDACIKDAKSLKTNKSTAFGTAGKVNHVSINKQIDIMFKKLSDGGDGL